MFVRIVKMSFSEEHIEDFLSNFEENKRKIRDFRGCNLLELYRDKNNSNIFFNKLFSCCFLVLYILKFFSK